MPAPAVGMTTPGVGGLVADKAHTHCPAWKGSPLGCCRPKWSRYLWAP